MSQASDTTHAAIFANRSNARTILAVCIGATVGSLLGALVYFVSYKLAVMLHQPHTAMSPTGPIICAIYAIIGAVIAPVMFPDRTERLR